MSSSAIRILIAVVLSVFVVVGVVAYRIVAPYPCSHPQVTIPEENRDKFARVAILMDGTRSMGQPTNFTLIKRIIQRQILPSLGLDDVAVTFDVQPSFFPQTNEAFGLSQDQMPQVSEIPRAKILEILKRNRASNTADEEMYNLIRKVEKKRDQISAVCKVWAAKVEARRSPEFPGSNICGALNEIGRWLTPQNPTADRWLFVLSDLQQDGAKQDCNPDLIPAGTKIMLIYSPKVQPADGFWRPFFGERKIQWVPLTTLAGDPLLPPNPLAKIEPHHIPAISDCAARLQGRAFLTGGALIAAIWLTVLALEWRNRRRLRRSSMPGPDISGA